MTLVLASLVDGKGFLAADRKVHFGPPGGPLQVAEAGKLFCICDCAVASFGESPPNIDVPRLIQAADGPSRSARDLAEVLTARISLLADRGNFGLLVVGSGRRDVELWEVLSYEQGFSRLQPTRPNMCCRGVQIAELPQIENALVAKHQMLSILRQAALQTHSIGPPYDVAEVRFGIGTTTERHAQ